MTKNVQIKYEESLGFIDLGADVRLISITKYTHNVRGVY